MTLIQRRLLYRKLGRLPEETLERAMAFCRIRGNAHVEVAHWLHQILQLDDSDLLRILRRFEIDPTRLGADVAAFLERLPGGAADVSDISPHVDEWVREAWFCASLLFDARGIRTAHMVLAGRRAATLSNQLGRISPLFDKLSPDVIVAEFAALLADSVEATAAPAPASAPGPAAPSRNDALARFTMDLTEAARAGKLDPIIGRDDEIRQMLDILQRRRKNNPILTGDAGVGKTAVVEGLAARIASGDVPKSLCGVRVCVLDLGLLQAGASVKGEFEQRLRNVLEAVEAATPPVVLFVDEAHTLIGAGGSAGTGDAANLLKPALARGTLRTIAATTWAEYKEHIEKDPALARRFEVVKVDEPDPQRTVAMLRAVSSELERHHGVRIAEPALEAAVRLSARYIPDRRLPDKAVGLLDTACARVAGAQQNVPARVERVRRRLEQLGAETRALAREAVLGKPDAARAEALAAETKHCGQQLAELEKRWGEQRVVVQDILGLQRRLLQPGAGDGQAASAVPELAEMRAELVRLVEGQADDPMVRADVDATVIAEVVADWTGVPLGNMLRDELQTVLSLPEILGRRVLGQDHALRTLSNGIQTGRAGLEEPGRPIGVFLLCGPSGVGKTETAHALAEALYGGEDRVININMSEFKERHAVATLRGSPPGYVGYGKGGVLTEAVRRKPHSVVLLDEIEKAHPDVHEVFYQVFDKGQMDDAEGHRIDFRNTVIILTSNVGTAVVLDACRAGKKRPSAGDLAAALRPPLLEVFPPAFLGRVSVVPYYPLDDARIADIAQLQLGRVAERLRANHGIRMTYDTDLVTLLTARCNEVESGARLIKAILRDTIVADMSKNLLSKMLDKQPVAAVHLRIRNGSVEQQLS